MDIQTAIVTINRNGIIQSVDRGCCKMFGYEVDQLLDQKINILIPSPYREQHDTYLSNYLRTGVAKIIGKARVVEGLHKNGNIFPIRLSVSSVSSSNILFIGMIEAVEDHTAVLTAREDGSIVSCNKLCTTLLGYASAELLQKKVQDLAPHDSNSSHPLKCIGSSLGVLRNVPLVLSAGMEYSFSVEVNPCDVGGTPHFRVSIDRVEEETTAVFTLDAAGVVLACNQTLLPAMCGYTRRELCGLHISKLIPTLSGWTASTYPDGSPFSSEEGDGDGSGVRSADGESSSGGSGGAVDSAAGSQAGAAAAAAAAEEVTEVDGAGHCECNGQADGESAGTVSVGQKRKTPDGSGQAPGSDGDASADAARAKRRRRNASWEYGQRNVCCVHKDGSVIVVWINFELFDGANGERLYSGRMRRMAQVRAGESHSSSGYVSSESMRASTGGARSKIIGDYEVYGNLGRGSYGKVKFGQHRRTGVEVAVKILHKDCMDASELERVRREIEIMRTLDHPHICKMHQAIETDTRVYIVLELACKGELYTYICERNRLHESEARKFFRQIVSAVEYCHKKNIIHRDIKHKNILLDAECNVKLIDFGLSNFTITGGLRSTFCGTPAYSAPEMILAQKYAGPEVDIWSMGVVLYSMVTGQFPFKTVSDIISGTFSPPVYLSEDIRNLFSGIFSVTPTSRLSLEAIKSHPWYAHEQAVVETRPIREIKRAQHLQDSSESGSSSASVVNMSGASNVIGVIGRLSSGSDEGADKDAGDGPPLSC